MTELLEGLQSSAPAALLRSSFVLYPLVNAVHILAIGMLVAGAVLMDLRLLGLAGEIPAETAIAYLRPFTVAALLVVLITGFLLFSVRPLDYVVNPAFQIKMALLALALANGLLFTLRRSRSVATGLGERLALLASLALWPAVLVAGRFIGFIE